MSFRPTIEQWPSERLQPLYRDASADAVVAALQKDDLSLTDLGALLSPAARAYLEPMAQKANRLTRWHFGRTISLYAPIYISNLCAADCVYCGFSVRSGNKEKRVTLKAADIHRECAGPARSVAVIVRSERLVGRYLQGRYNTETFAYHEGEGPTQVPFELEAETV